MYDFFFAIDQDDRIAGVKFDFMFLIPIAPLQFQLLGGGAVEKIRQIDPIKRRMRFSSKNGHIPFFKSAPGHHSIQDPQPDHAIADDDQPFPDRHWIGQ